MKRVRPFALSLLAGFCAAYLFGFIRVRESAAHLLEKNLALKDSGQIPLPGEGHFDTLASLNPALFGALFFAIALGAGAAALGFFYGSFLRFFGDKARKILSLASFAPSVWALLLGDILLALALAAIFFTATSLGMAGEKLKGKEIIEPLAALLIAALSFSPILLSDSGGFITVRNAMVRAPALRAVSDFYYRWTLYPAESIKPLIGLSQPLAGYTNGFSRQEHSKISTELLSLGFLTVNGEKGVDLKIEKREGAAFLARGGVFVKWPEGAEAQKEAIKELSAASDKVRPARNAMLALLVGGFPLCVFGIFYYTGKALFSSNKIFRFAYYAAFCGVLLALGLMDNAKYLKLERELGQEELKIAFSSPDPVLRLYAARGAARFPVELENELIGATFDSILNVRYSAALSLGGSGSQKAAARLEEILRGNEDWYVKDRAWWAKKGP